MIKTNNFFASANTSQGFKSYFNIVFNPFQLEKIYILKGGPGTGKSSLIRRIANQGKENGMQVDEFLCSSDPTSLDGAVIGDIGIAIIDGTSPHTVDPNYPGVVEHIINTGSFWNKDILKRNKKEIISLIQEKNRHYKRAYQFLKGLGEIQADILKIGEKCLLEAKLEPHISALTKRLFKNQGNNREEVRLISAINQRGFYSLDTFLHLSKTVYLIEDEQHTALEYIRRIYEKAKCSQQNMWISYSPLFPEKIDALYFPDLSLVFQIGERNYEEELPGKKYHYINMQRFIDKEKKREHKQKIRFGNRCCEMLKAGAIESFTDSARAHSKLEQLYQSAMNFDCLTKETDSLFKEIFG